VQRSEAPLFPAPRADSFLSTGRQRRVDFSRYDMTPCFLFSGRRPFFPKSQCPLDARCKRTRSGFSFFPRICCIYVPHGPNKARDDSLPGTAADGMIEMTRSCLMIRASRRIILCSFVNSTPPVPTLLARNRCDPKGIVPVWRGRSCHLFFLARAVRPHDHTGIPLFLPLSSDFALYCVLLSFNAQDSAFFRQMPSTYFLRLFPFFLFSNRASSTTRLARY